VLYLTPLLKAKHRIERFASISRRIVDTSKRHPWLSIPLLPPHLLVRWLSRREYDRLNDLGYPLTRQRTRV
jgi:hypothetical protein